MINESGGNFDLTETIREIELEMLEAANNLEFEKAALLRDQLRELKRGLGHGSEANSGGEKPRSINYSKPISRRKRRPGVAAKG